MHLPSDDIYIVLKGVHMPCNIVRDHKRPFVVVAFIGEQWYKNLYVRKNTRLDCDG